MTLTVTPLYAAALALLMVALSVAVTARRARTGISILHGEDTQLAELIRRHGNFAEYVPMALILMAFAELSGAPSGWLHATGLILLISRILHPLGLRHDKGATPLRIAGGSGTWVAILLAAGLILAVRLGG